MQLKSPKRPGELTVALELVHNLLFITELYCRLLDCVIWLCNCFDCVIAVLCVVTVANGRPVESHSLLRSLGLGREGCVSLGV